MLDRNQPVFIVGAPRTGSSFVCEALIRGAGLVGGAEGHILPLLVDLDAQVAGYYQLMRNMGMLAIPGNTVAQIDEMDLRGKVAEIFRLYYQNIYGTGRWVDKTVNVGMIEALPRLLEIFPHSRVIYLKRNGIRNVISAVKYFDVDFEQCCRNWAQCGEAWGRIRTGLPQERIVEIEHEQLVETPSEVAGLLAKHLLLSSEARKELLRFMVIAACEWKSSTNAEFTLETAGWADDQRAMFIKICGNQMVRQGYLSELELDAFRSRYRRSDRYEISPSAAKVLQAESAYSVAVREGQLWLVPGRSGATVVMFEQLDVAGMSVLSMCIGVSSPISQGVRFEFIGIDCSNGELVTSRQFELAALQQQDIVLEIKPHTEQLDLVIRVVRGRDARKNDHSWSFVKDVLVSS
ncbi:sulfotransferase family protein [Methyloglobulus sp.]|uniref:sulfotransferase family protein n=1 Tax=Methyloglobulus sp. TaxID=2518622 RepID=UPI003989FC74